MIAKLETCFNKNSGAEYFHLNEKVSITYLDAQGVQVKSDGNLDDLHAKEMIVVLDTSTEFDSKIVMIPLSNVLEIEKYVAPPKPPGD